MAEIDSAHSETQHHEKECKRMKTKIESMKMMIEEQCKELKKFQSDHMPERSEEYRKILSHFK